MTPQGARLVAAIRGYYDEHGYAPSVRDLMTRTGMSSTSVVTYWLRKLRADGLVDYEDRVPRSIHVTGGLR